MRLLLETHAEYGWRFSGVRSWGGNWHRKACSRALEEIRDKLSNIVNLKELEVFTKKNLKNDFKYEPELSEDKISFKISLADEGDLVDYEKRINANNLLVLVDNIYIKQGTDYTKGRDERPRGGRSWEASAIMVYRLRIFGP